MVNVEANEAADVSKGVKESGVGRVKLRSVCGTSKAVPQRQHEIMTRTIKHEKYEYNE